MKSYEWECWGVQLSNGDWAWGSEDFAHPMTFERRRDAKAWIANQFMDDTAKAVKISVQFSPV